MTGQEENMQDVIQRNRRAAQLALCSCMMMSALSGCASSADKEFINSFNSAQSIEFSMPYSDSSTVFAGLDYTLGENDADLQKKLLAASQAKTSDGKYLMTNTTLMGALCNPDNDLGYYINPSVTSPNSTLTVDDVNTMDGAVSHYINDEFRDSTTQTFINYGDTSEDKNISTKYLAANAIYEILPVRDYNGTLINPYTQHLTRAQAMVALCNAFYGHNTIPVDYPDNIDTQKIDAAIQSAVSAGALSEDTVAYKFINDNKRIISWMDQFSYLKIADNEMGATMLFREISYGEFEYMLGKLLAYNGTILNSDIIEYTDSIEKSLQGGYTVKSLDEIIEKAAKSNKITNQAISNKTTAVLRQMNISQAKTTVESSLYSSYVQMLNLKLDANTEKQIFDTITVDEMYKALLKISDYYKSNALTWIDYKWVDPNPAPEPEPEPEPTYKDIDGAVAAWLITNNKQTADKLGIDVDSLSGDVVDKEIQTQSNGESDVSGDGSEQSDSEASGATVETIQIPVEYDMDTFELKTITESDHETTGELKITGINLDKDAYNALYEYLYNLGIKPEDKGDFCKNPLVRDYSSWITEKESAESDSNAAEAGNESAESGSVKQ